MSAKLSDLVGIMGDLSLGPSLPQRPKLKQGELPKCQKSPASYKTSLEKTREYQWDGYGDEVVYIIFAHGTWLSKAVTPPLYLGFEKHPPAKYPIGHGTVISGDMLKHLVRENVRFGVLACSGSKLVGEILPSGIAERRQDAVIRMGRDIINGKINVYERFPWIEGEYVKTEGGRLATKKQDTKGITPQFPNFIFQEGGEEPLFGDGFVATIARRFRGKWKYFELQESALKKILVPFKDKSGAHSTDASFYPSATEFIKRANHYALLSQILPPICKDINKLKTDTSENVKGTIIFATCLEHLPPNIERYWSGQASTKTIPYIGGGKWHRQKKYNKKKRSRRRHKKHKTRKKHKGGRKHKTRKKHKGGRKHKIRRKHKKSIRKRVR